MNSCKNSCNFSTILREFFHYTNQILKRPQTNSKKNKITSRLIIAKKTNNYNSSRNKLFVIFSLQENYLNESIFANSCNYFQNFLALEQHH